MKTLNHTCFILFVFLFSNCSTLFFGGRQKIAIKSNVSGLTIRTNDPDIGASFSQNEVTIKKSQKKPIITLSIQGYETQTFELTRTKSFFKSLMGAYAGVGGITAIIVARTKYQTSLAFASSVYSTPKPVFDPTPYYALGGVLVVSAIVDLCTQANATFSYKELEFDMVPVPTKVTTPDVNFISCDGVNIKIQPGKKIGTHYEWKSGNFAEDKSITWDQTSNVNLEDLEVQVNNVLDAFGYPVPGLSNKFEKDKDKARYMLSAEFLSIEQDEFVHNNPKPVSNQQPIGNMILIEKSMDRKCSARVKWTLFDTRLGKVVYEMENQTLVWVNSETFKLALIKSIDASVKKLLNEESFFEAVKKTNTNLITSNFSEKIEIKSLTPPEKMGELVEAAITVDLGGSHGSGFIISDEGYAITNYHVVGNDKKVNVILSNGIIMESDVIRVNEGYDLALLKIPGKGFKAMPVNFNSVTLAEEVTAIGTPGRVELGQTITKGIVSGKREIEGAVLIQTDVSVSPGNSGGALLNKQNQVIGIINPKLVGKGIEGVAFAIPIEIGFDKLGLIKK